MRKKNILEQYVKQGSYWRKKKHFYFWIFRPGLHLIIYLHLLKNGHYMYLNFCLFLHISEFLEKLLKYFCQLVMHFAMHCSNATAYWKNNSLYLISKKRYNVRKSKEKFRIAIFWKRQINFYKISDDVQFILDV